MLTPRRTLLLSVLFVLISTSVFAQDNLTPEPLIATTIPTDIPTTTPTDIPPTLTPTDEPPLIPTATNTQEPLPTATATETTEPLPSATATDVILPTDIPSLTPSAVSTETATEILETEASPTLTLSPSLTASPTVTLTPSATPGAEVHNAIGIQMPQAGAATCNPSIPLQIASVSSSGVQGGVSGSINSFTSDGRYLYFTSASMDLVANDTNNKNDIFQFDRTTCQTIRVSVGPNGEEGNNDSNTPAVSANGRYLAFASLASNFSVNDTNNKYDIYVKDLQTGSITLIVADSSSAIASYNIGVISISDDGHFVTFDVVQSPSLGVYQGTPVLYDLQNSTRTVIASEGRSPTISGNGEFIAFVSSLSTLVNGDTNNIDDLFVYSRTPNTYIRASVKGDGSQTTAPEDYFSLAISGDGRYVSFTTAANLVSDDTNNSYDVYLRDTLANQTTRVSVSSSGTQSATGGTGGSMSADGRYIVFLAPDGSLVSGDSNGVADLFVRDLQTPQTYRITNANLSISSSLISPDGQYIAFNSFLTSADSIANNHDVFIAHRLSFVPPPSSPTPTFTDSPLTATARSGTLNAVMTATKDAETAFANATATAAATSCNAASAAPMQVASVSYLGGFGNKDSGTYELAISSTGRYVAFISSATNLVPSDNNGYDDVFIFDRQFCQVTLISKSLTNVQANNTSSSLAMSANGQIIAFYSLATNLVAGDTNSGIFIRNLTSNTLIRIPFSGSTSSFPSISGDGRYVTYTDRINATTRNIMLYDVLTGQSKLIEAVPFNGTYSKISRDASKVIYFNAASSLSIYTVSSQQTLPLTVNMDPAASLDLSANGRYIVFGSNAIDLVANDTNGKMDVFLLDQQTSQITRVSLGSGGTEISGSSAFPAISPDGDYVSFITNSDLAVGDNNSLSDVYVYNRIQQTTYWVSHGLNGAAGNNGSGAFINPISEGGQFVAFTSGASNLVAGDTGFKIDVFIAALSPVPDPQLETPTPTATATAGASNILGIGQYQETSAQLTYTGSWVTYNGTEPKGGSFKYTNAANGKVTFSVNNTVGRIVFYRTTYTIYGSSQIYLDGASTPIATINNNSSNLLFGVPFTLTIPPGNHTIELRNGGTKYSSIDQIDLLPPAIPLTINTYQETEPNLSYSGNWVNNDTPAALGGSRRYTNDPNATVSFKVNSSVGRITIYRSTYLAGAYGSLQVFIDNESTPLTTINNTSSTFLFQQPFAFAIIPGSHTITLKNVGSTYSDIDQITLHAPATLGIGSYQETNPNFTYFGKWTSNITPSASGGSRIYTNDPNGSMTFNTDSTVSRIIIYRSTYLTGAYGSLQVFVDGALTPFATINNTSSTFLFQQPFSFEVAPGSHTITLKNVGTTFSDIDQITLLAPPTSLGTGSFAETEANLTYSGKWTAETIASALGGSRMVTNDPNGKVTFAVNNSVGKVTIYRSTNLAGVYGSMQVFVDDRPTPLTTINNTSSVFRARQPFTFTITPGDHIITLKNVGSTYSDIDQITLAAAPIPLSVGDYQETESRLIYNGIWTANSAELALGNARIYTNDPNATVSFTIDSSVGKVTIHRSTYLPGVYGSLQVFVDDAATPLTTINNTSALFFFQQPFTFAVIPGNHTITLKNVGSTYSDIDQISLQPAPAALGIGDYSENDMRLIYSGNWTANTTPSALGSSRIYTNDPNGSVTFSIQNTVGRVTIYRSTYTAGYYGSFQVFVDGAYTPYTTINNTSATFLFQQPFTFLVTPGNHTITLRNVGTTFSDLDQITLAAPDTPLALGDHQESEPSLIYNGTWTTNTTASALGGARKYTNDPSATVTFTINSSVGKITIYRSTYIASAYGAMQVFLDNRSAPLATINNTSSTFLFQQPFTFAVVPGSHTITLKNVGSTYSDIDQITLAPPDTPLALGDHQETEPNLIYSGTWATNMNTSALGGTRKYTNDPNATVSFNIDNSVGRITIFRTTYITEVYGSMQFFLDNSPTPLTTINNTSKQFLFQQPFTFAVIPGNHIITLKNVGSTYSDIDQITLAPATSLSVGNYQETELGLIYNGTWSSNTTTAALGGSRLYTNDPYATVSFAIDNTVGRITIYRSTYLTGVYGSFQVFVDGAAAPFTTINNTSSAFLFQQPFSFTLTPGNHIITLKNVGTTYSDLDQITLTAS